MSPDLLERIRAKTIVDGNGCWIWQAAKNSKGYGQIGLRNGFKPNGHIKTISKSVHRLVAGLTVGRALEGKEVACHTCDVRACVNPEHLYVGSQGDNARDMYDRGRDNNIQAARNRAKTHCPKQHEYTTENTVMRGPIGKQFRVCKTCDNANRRAWKAAARLAAKQQRVAA